MDLLDEEEIKKAAKPSNSKLWTEKEIKDYADSGYDEGHAPKQFKYKEFEPGYDAGDEHTYSPEAVTRANEVKEAKKEVAKARAAEIKAREEAEAQIKEAEAQQKAIEAAERETQLQPVGETIPEGEFDPDERERDASYLRGKQTRASKKVAEIDFEQRHPQLTQVKSGISNKFSEIMNKNPTDQGVNNFFKDAISLGSAGKEKLYDPLKGYIGEKIENYSDNRKVDLGAGVKNINKFHELKDQLDRLDPDDKATAAKLKREMKEISLIMRDNIAQKRKEKRKEEKERLMDNLQIEKMIIANEKAKTAAYNKKDPSIRPIQPKEWKMKPNVKLGGTKMLGGINLSGTSAGGLNLAPVRANIPVFRGPAPAPQPTPKQTLQAVREMHQRKAYEKEYSRQVAIAQRRQYEKQVEGSIVRQNRVEQARGQLPPAQLGMAMQQQQRPQQRMGTKFRMPDVIVPSFKGLQQNSSMKPRITTGTNLNNKFIQKPVGKLNQNKSSPVTGVSHIVRGIENMIAPVRTRAHVHKQKVYGAVNTNASDVHINTDFLSRHQHVGRKFGLDTAPVKINLDTKLTLGKKKKKIKG